MHHSYNVCAGFKGLPIASFLVCSVAEIPRVDKYFQIQRRAMAMVSSVDPSSTKMMESMQSFGNSSYVMRKVRAALYAGITTTTLGCFKFPLSGFAPTHELVAEQSLPPASQPGIHAWIAANKTLVTPRHN